MTDKNLWGNVYLWLLATSVLFVAVVEVLPGVTPLVTPLHAALWNFSTKDVNFCVSCLGASLLFLIAFKAKPWELFAVLVPGAILELVFRSFRPEAPSLYWTHMWQIGSGLFPFALIFALLRVYRLFRSGNRVALVQGLEILGLGVVLPVFYTASGGLIGLRGERYVYDGRLLASDVALFGTQPAFVLSSWLRHCTVSDILMNFVYDYLAMWMLLSQILVYIQQKHGANSRAVRFYPVLTFAVVSLIGMQCYRYLPAVGTQAFCGSAIFPDGPFPDPNSVLAPVEAPQFLPRNCMPSLHLTYILCAALAVCTFKKSYLYTGLSLVVLTLLSAFSVGLHWASDFLVALPFTVLCLSLTCLSLPWLIRGSAIMWGTGASFGLMYVIKNYPTLLLDCHWEYASVGVAVVAVSVWLLVSIVRAPGTKHSDVARNDEAPVHLPSSDE